MGNVRLSYFKNGSNSAEVLEENNYYPFGMKHEGYNALAGNPAYNYQYNGKEVQKETGWSDYGARMYMPEIGRWGVIDPLAEALRRHTPYNYGVNNPVMFIDPDGRLSQSFIDGMMSSGSGTTWTNTGDGFSDGRGGTMGYNGRLGGSNKANAANLSLGNNEETNFKQFSPNDVIILIDSKAVGGLGHAAVLIGSEKDGWYYYSLNGTGGDKGRPYGDAIGADVGTNLGKVSMEEAIKLANTINPNYTHHYDKNLALLSSRSEDKEMMKVAAKAAGVNKYILTDQDCLTVPMAAFNKLKHMRMGGGVQTAKVPNAWRFYLPLYISAINMYLPSASEIKYK